LLSDLREEKENSDSENVYLRQILSRVSAREPQLGMMIRQFKKEDGFSVGYKYSQADFESVLDKVLEWSKLSPDSAFPRPTTPRVSSLISLRMASFRSLLRNLPRSLSGSPA